MRTLIALLAIAALPLAAERLRGKVERCAMDGVAVQAAFRVSVKEPGGNALPFCGVTCADAWVRLRGVAPAEILVTDGATGKAIDGAGASFVRTFVNRSGGAPDGIRVFAGREDALRHVEAHGGTLLSGADRPFAGTGEERDTDDN